MAKKHTYVARRATTIQYGSPVVIIKRTKFETWHIFAADSAADSAAQHINETGRLPREIGTGQRYFEKLKIFGFPDQYAHYEKMENQL